MKKRWLVGLSAVAMSIALCMGIAACNNGSNDADIVTDVIDTLTVMYEGGSNVTNNDYQLFGQVKQGSGWYDVAWSASSDAVSDITQYVTFGKVDETTRQLTVSIKRSTEQDIPYTLTATVTVGKASESVKFDRTIQKKSSEDSITASLDLSAAANRTTFDTDNNEQVWQQNGVTLTNSGNVADYTPIRLYKNTTVKIEMENAKIIHIDFHSAQGYDDSPYPEYLKTSIESSDLPIKGEVAVSEDGLTISVDFETPLDVVTFKTTAGQCRLTSIDVEAIERDPDEHVHNWTSYQHVEGTWTHTATCSAEGCDVNTKTEACTPKLNVCECGYTYSAKEIVDALFALEKDQSLPGTYSLTGVVTAITDPYSTQYKNVTFEMTVEGQTVTAYRVKGTYATEVEVGGTATVTGELLDFNGKKEFTMGGSVVAFVPGVDERTPQQKVTDALSDLSDTFIVTKAGETELPASTEKDVTFTWATENKTYTITGNKINVASLPAEDVTVTATVTATCGTEAVTNNTKTVTITIKAEGAALEGFTPITAPAAGSDYYLAMDIKGEWYYSTGAKSGNYLGTTTDISKAAKVTLAPSGDGWTLVTNGKYIEFETSEPNTSGKTYVNIMLKDAQTEGKVWMWNAQYSVFTMEEGGETYFMGTYGDYNTFNSAKISFIDGEDEYIGKIGTYTGEVTPPTPSEEVKLPDGDVKLDFSSVTEKGTEITSGDATDYFKGFTESADLTAAAVTEKVYKGNGTGGGDYENAGGMLKLGTSKVGATITLTFAKNVTKVVIMAQGWPGKSDTLAVNDGTAQTMSGSEKALYTFELTAPAKEIKITSNVRAFIFGIVVTFEGGTTTPKTDAEKLADAKTALKLSKTSLDAVGAEVELPATQGEASVTYELQGTTDLVKIEGGKLIVLKLPETDTEITIKATLTVGQETDNVDLKVTILAPEPEIKGELLYTLTTAVEQGENTSYTGNGDIEVDGVKWNLEGNSQMNPWRLGGKSSNCNGADRKLTSKTTFGGTVQSLAITFGTATVTVNSVTFNVFTSDPTAADAKPSFTKTVKFTASGTVNVAAPADGWKDCYYQLVFNLTATTDSQNQYVQISKIEFYGIQPAHVHQYTYKHNADDWTHTGTCSVPGCDKPEITEKCSPKLNVCEDCDYTYTPSEIVTKLYSLSSGQTMPGTYSLKGEVTKIDTVYNSQYSNVTFTITVENKTVQCYREKSSYSSKVKVGDIVTVEGSLTCYGSSATKEFNANCKIVALEEPEVPDEQKPQELKIYDAFGNEIANGSTLKINKDFRMRIHGHVLPDTAPQITGFIPKCTASVENIVHYSNGDIEVAYGKVGDKVDLTFSVEGLENPTVIHIEIVSDEEYVAPQAHGMTKDDPFTADELLELVKKVTAIDNVGVCYNATVNGYFFVKGMIVDFFNSSTNTHFILGTSSGDKIDLGTFSSMNSTAEDITSWMSVQLGSEVVVSAQWAKLTKGDYEFGTNTWSFGIHKLTPPSDTDRLEYAQKYVGDDFVKTTFDRFDIEHLPKQISYLIPAELSWKFLDNEHSDIIVLDTTTYNSTDYNIIKILALPKADTTVTLELTVTSGEESITKTFTLTVKGNTENFGTKEAPLTLAEAIALGTKICVDANSWTPTPIYVKGLAETTLVDHGDGRYDDFNLVADADAKLLVSYCGVKEGSVIYQNDELVIFGFLQKLSDGTFKVYSRSYTSFTVTSFSPVLETVTAGKSTVTLEVAGATVTGLEATQQKTNGEAVSFSVSPEAGKQIVYVSVNGAFITAQEGKYSFKVEGDMAVVVKVAAEGEKVALTANYDSTAQGYEKSAVVESAKVNDVDLTFSKGDTGSDIIYSFRGYLTLRKDHTFTVAVPAANYKITKITFTYKSGSPTMTADTETLNEDCTVWTGSAESVVFTVTSNSMYLVSINIEYEYTVPAAAAAAVAPVALLPEKKN